jgi:MoaD family protein
MRVKFLFFATYRKIFGERHIDLDVSENCDVRTAIDLFLEQFPVLKPHWCNQAGELMPHLFIILNKQDVASLPEGLNTKLKPGDEVDFVPPVGGG